jgi:hypothetical protein|tara:strand:- start:10087 stop:10482 length:396 start_codon:yes stop_codon:yes gene_type:complete
MATESIFKAMCSYIKGSSLESDNNYYPSQAPQGASDPYVIISMIDNNTDVIHGGSYTTGDARFQFDFYCKTLSILDDRVEKLKNAFVGQSFDLTTNTSLAYCTCDNEFDEFDDEGETYIRSVDLVFKYIFK